MTTPSKLLEPPFAPLVAGDPGLDPESVPPSPPVPPDPIVIV